MKRRLNHMARVMAAVVAISLPLNNMMGQLLPCDLLFFEDSEGMGAAVKESTGRYSHVAIVVRAEGDSAEIIDATRLYGVAERRVMWKAVGCHVYRLTKQVDTAEVINRAKSLVGRSYDEAFAAGDDKYYCSELVCECYVDADKHPIFGLEPMNFRAADGSMPSYWTAHFKRLGREIPEGELGSNPTSLSRLALLRKVF